MSRWTARVAPLGVPSVDGRLLEPGRWTLVGLVPLVTVGADRRVVGRVDAVSVESDVIVASGTVDDVEVARRMGARELRPALELGEGVDVLTTVGADAVARFRPGRIAALALVETPAWADVWFEVDEA